MVWNYRWFRENRGWWEMYQVSYGSILNDTPPPLSLRIDLFHALIKTVSCKSSALRSWEERLVAHNQKEMDKTSIGLTVWWDKGRYTTNIWVFSCSSRITPVNPMYFKTVTSCFSWKGKNDWRDMTRRRTGQIWKTVRYTLRGAVCCETSLVVTNVIDLAGISCLWLSTIAYWLQKKRG